jgi:hypothetical protein
MTALPLPHSYSGQRVVRAVLVTWLVTAAWDFICASALSVFAYHSTFSRLWQGVAATALGPSALQMGAWGIVAGLVLHAAVAFAWSSLFVAALASSERLRRVVDRPVGAFVVACIYGPVIWLVMSLAVIPLATGRPPTFAFRWWVQIFAHVPFVTLPLVFTARRALGQGFHRPDSLQASTVVALVVALLATGARSVASQATSEESSYVRDYARGLLSNYASVPESGVRDRCIPLPMIEPLASGLDDGQHGDSLVATRCEVLSYHRLDTAPGGPWFVAEYRLTSVYTPSGAKSQEPSKRDTVTHGEMVLLASAGLGQLRPVWHQLFDYAMIRSMKIEVAPAVGRATLLSVKSCFNGTGGCHQEFLRRASDGRWGPVSQVWLLQLPRGFPDRIQHGFQIDPRTLRGEAGFYGAHDANCCPSQTLNFWLRLRGDSLVLQGHRVTSTP